MQVNQSQIEEVLISLASGRGNFINPLPNGIEIKNDCCNPSKAELALDPVLRLIQPLEQ